MCTYTYTIRTTPVERGGFTLSEVTKEQTKQVSTPFKESEDKEGLSRGKKICMGHSRVRN